MDTRGEKSNDRALYRERVGASIGAATATATDGSASVALPYGCDRRA